MGIHEGNYSQYMVCCSSHGQRVDVPLSGTNVPGFSSSFFNERKRKEPATVHADPYTPKRPSPTSRDGARADRQRESEEKKEADALEKKARR